MVSSLTALRTRIKQKYGKEGTKTADGIFVAHLAMNSILEEDKICYQAEPVGEGVLFKLNVDNIRPLPSTQSAFLLAATRKGLQILSMSTRTAFSPQQEKDVIVREYNRGIGDYSVVDVEYIGSKQDMLFAKQTYLQSTSNPTHFRCYFRLSKPRKMSYSKFISLLEFVAEGETGKKWEGMSLEQVRKSILEGETELLLQEIQEVDVWA